MLYSFLLLFKHIILSDVFFRNYIIYIFVFLFIGTMRLHRTPTRGPEAANLASSLFYLFILSFWKFKVFSWYYKIPRGRFGGRDHLKETFLGKYRICVIYVYLGDYNADLVNLSLGSTSVSHLLSFSVGLNCCGHLEMFEDL